MERSARRTAMLKRIRELLGRRGKKAETESANGAAVASARPPVRRGPKVVHWPIASADLDPDAVKIVRRLTRFDHRAYLVGGCVRDLLLERKPKDFDVATSATPGQIKRVFRNCRIIGRRFRLAHIYFQNGKIIEVATFRAVDDHEPAEDEPQEQEKDLLIRDDNVFGTPEEDALRRDFTINALFYSVGEETVLDHTDGLGDLRRKLIRTIGDPEIRFREDPIRILRAIKFAARLDFKIEKKTLASLRGTRTELDRAATARVLEEINRFCRSGAARRSFELLGETEVFEVVFPEIAKHYARHRESRTLMLDLLGRMDEVRGGNRREIRTGEIFAAVLLPLLAPRFGWKTDGTTTRPSGLNLRQTIDDMLRPMALRLRIPRREQEHCRQILATLFRMVPARRIRRNTKRAILRRECLPDSIWVLGLLADRFGEEFAAAHTYWAAEPPEPRAAEEAPPRSRRGRKRSRGRTKKPAGEQRRPAVAASKEAAPAKEATKNKPPAKWDDDYFFAALPSAPELSGDETQGGDRYGASAVAAQGDDAGEPRAEKSEPTTRARSKRKRRRRRRRPGASKSKKTTQDDQADSVESGKASDSGRTTATE
jgi:poly(A) polymerase